MKRIRPLLPIEVSDKELGYFAGLIDGEGSVCITNTKDRKRQTSYWVLQLRIFNTNLAALEWLIPRFGGKIFRGATQTSRHKQSYMWIATTRPALVLLELAKPCLLIKRRHAEIALQFFPRMWTAKDEARDNGLPVGQIKDDKMLWDLYEELRALNRRGPPP